jgi:hypothetical protein
VRSVSRSSLHEPLKFRRRKQLDDPEEIDCAATIEMRASRGPVYLCVRKVEVCLCSSFLIPVFWG